MWHRFVLIMTECATVYPGQIHIGGGCGGEGYFTKFSVAGFSMQFFLGPNRIYGFVKMRCQKDLKSM